MLNEQVFSNARVVTAEQVFTGTVVVRDGLIAEVESGCSQLSQAQDMQGDYLLPGLVELHTDNLEKHLSPRPGVDWPSV
ncbi:phosphonate metabolism protein PhnM, partial [Pseudomonas syringae pv. syringae FF5]